MQPLDKTLRNGLERTIKNARDVAEAAAHSALGQLAVAQAVADKHLGDKERSLRNRLRVHGRQLGDLRNPNGEQEIGRLIEEVAYEHWHRMLFARFLAENDLCDGFAVLVNYHKFDAKLLETLIYNYLGDWISRQKQDIDNGVDGAEEKLAAAENLKKKLELILKGEAPHDIFVRWKPIDQQPIGWNPDLNDGVRMTIRPFMTAGDIKKKGAGILRDKPNIKWGKDRGKDVESAPWYHLGPEYGGKEGDRINDHHLSLAEKKGVHEKGVQT